MKKSEMAQNLYFLSVLTVITVFTWISLDLYRTIKKVETTKVSPEILEPLDPEIDTQALDRLARRKEFSEDDLIFPSPTPEVSPTPTLILTPIPTVTMFPQEATPASTITPIP